MQIVVSVLLPDPVNEAVQGPPPKGPGKRFVFSKNLVLERLDNNTPGAGLPQSPQQRHAGTYSGLVTVLRVAKRLFGFKGGSGCFGSDVIRLRRAVSEAGNDQSL